MTVKVTLTLTPAATPQAASAPDGSSSTARAPRQMRT
jgi:hypothetical protein